MSRSYKYAVLSWPGINKLPDFPDFSLTCSCAGIPVSFASQYRTPFAVLSCKECNPLSLRYAAYRRLHNVEKKKIRK